LRVRRLLNVNIATLAVLATVMLGMGRQSVALPLGMLLAVCASVWLTDVTGRFRLSAAAVNVGVILAAAVLIGRMMRSRWTLDFPAVAEVFFWVQILLLFEEKTRRTWWDLIALSLVQVLLAAMMNQGPLFGLVLVVFLFFGLSALTLLLLDREQTSRHRAGRTPGSAEVSPRPGDVDRFRWGRLGKIALATLAVGPLSLFLRYREPAPEVAGESDAATPSSSAGRWPLWGRTPVFADSPAPRRDQPELGGEFWGRIGGMALTSLLVSLVVFCAVPRFGRFDFMFPRFGRVKWRESSLRRSVGFSDRVTLGELGMIIENPEQVLQVRFVDPGTGQRYPVQGDVFLRGAVLTRYQAGHWEHELAKPRFRLLKPDERPPDGSLVRQEITIEPMDREELFCIWPFVMTQEDERLQFDAPRERLRRPAEMREQRFSFELGTTAFVEGMQESLTPCQNPVDAQPLLQWPSGSLPGLAALADQWIVESGIPADDPLNRARFLERQLRESDRFVYSLEGTARDGMLDPIEDFIVNNPRGHCEYFATALTLILRSQGIPARLVVGYKCDEYGYLSQAYLVRQSHAHTWVEAYVAPQDLSPELRQRSRSADWSNGGWLRLDPTPVGSGAGATVGSVAREMGSWFQWLGSVWKRDVLGMSQARQRELIYRPLATGAILTIRNVVDPQWWRTVLRTAGREVVALPWRLWERGSLGRRVVLLVAVLASGLVLAYYGSRFLPRKLRRHLPGLGDARAGNTRPRVAFYRRLEAVLARHGLNRSVSQTQREFAREAGARIVASTGQSGLIHLPARVAEAFYQVRFGGQALAPREAAAVDEALTRLEQASDGRQDGRQDGSLRDREGPPES